jgi:hypothetical protein
MVFHFVYQVSGKTSVGYEGKAGVTLYLHPLPSDGKGIEASAARPEIGPGPLTAENALKGTGEEEFVQG